MMKTHRHPTVLVFVMAQAPEAKSPPVPDLKSLRLLDPGLRRDTA